MSEKITSLEGDHKILPWIVVLLLSTSGKIILIKDAHGRYVLPRKEGGSLAENLEFSYEDTIEKIFQENKIEYENIKKMEILGDKKIFHPEARKIFVHLEITNAKILSPYSKAGFYFPTDIFNFPSKEEDQKLISKFFR